MPATAELRRLKQTYRVLAVTGPPMCGRKTLARELAGRLGADTVVETEISLKEALERSASDGLRRVVVATPPGDTGDDLTPSQRLEIFWIPGPKGNGVWRFKDVEIKQFFRSNQLGEVSDTVVQTIRERGRAVPAWLTALAARALSLQREVNLESLPELAVYADKLFFTELTRRLAPDSQQMLKRAAMYRFSHEARARCLEGLDARDTSTLSFFGGIRPDGKISTELVATLRDSENFAFDGELPVNLTDTPRSRMEHVYREAVRGNQERAGAEINQHLWEFLRESTIPEFLELTGACRHELGILAFQFRVHWLAHASRTTQAITEIDERLSKCAEGSDDWTRLMSSKVKATRLQGSASEAGAIAESALQIRAEHRQHPGNLADALLLREAAQSLRVTHLTRARVLLNAAQSIDLDGDPTVVRWARADQNVTAALFEYVNNDYAIGTPMMSECAQEFRDLGLAPEELLAIDNVHVGARGQKGGMAKSPEVDDLMRAREIGASFVEVAILDNILRAEFRTYKLETVVELTNSVLSSPVWMSHVIGRRVLALRSLNRLKEAQALIEEAHRRRVFSGGHWGAIAEAVSIVCKNSILSETQWDTMTLRTQELASETRLLINVLYLEESLLQWRVCDPTEFTQIAGGDPSIAELFCTPLVAIHNLFLRRTVRECREVLEKAYRDANTEGTLIALGVIVPFLALVNIAAGDLTRARTLLKERPEKGYHLQFFRFADALLAFAESPERGQAAFQQIESEIPSGLRQRFLKFLEDALKLTALSATRKYALSGSTPRAVLGATETEARLREFQGISVNVHAKQASIFKQNIDNVSNPVLYRLVALLALNYEKSIPVDDVARRVWDEAFNPLVHISRINTLVFRLREALPEGKRQGLESTTAGMRLTSAIPVLVATPTRSPGEISEIGEWILSYVKKRGSIENRTVVKARAVSSATAKREVRELVSRGLILPRGKGRGATYTLP